MEAHNPLDSSPARTGPPPTASAPRELLSLVIPVFNEAENIVPLLREIAVEIQEPCEVLIVYDFPEDTTVPAVQAMQPPDPRVQLVHNTLGRGVLNALKAGMQTSRGDVIVVMMADRSDEPKDVPPMARLIRGGADVVAGSRYMKGGGQEGGPLFKRFLSWLAGKSLHYLAGLPIQDATNNFRAYSRRVLEQLPIEGQASFAVALELTVKAHWQGWRVTEVPTTWHDRLAGQSRFRLFAWMPHYFKWWWKAVRRAWFGPPIPRVS